MGGASSASDLTEGQTRAVEYLLLIAKQTASMVNADDVPIGIKVENLRNGSIFLRWAICETSYWAEIDPDGRYRQLYGQGDVRYMKKDGMKFRRVGLVRWAHCHERSDSQGWSKPITQKDMAEAADLGA